LIVELGSGIAGGFKASGGEFDPSEAYLWSGGAGFRGVEAKQEVAGARVEEGVVGEGSGGNDTLDFASHESFGRGGIFDLFTDGHTEALAYEAGEVAFELVVREAGHGDGVFPFIAAGEGKS
jgi:hypothetical protein